MTTQEFASPKHHGPEYARPAKGASGPMPDHVDVLIVGAGISGVGMAYRLQERLPELTYAIAEAREVSGGTWDLFRYPGVRSDSDMFTLSYPFKPWEGRDAIAEGGDILDYLRETADENGISEHIHYQHKVVAANWSTPDQAWTITLDVKGKTREVKANYIHLAAGYYDYDKGNDPEFEGRKDFKGQIWHPQFWPENADYTGKKVVVIGSGATAVTVVPAMAETAEHVVMLQRTPSWLIPVPRRDKVVNNLRPYVPGIVLHKAARAKNIAQNMFIYQLSRVRPEAANKIVVGFQKGRIPDDIRLEHFTPEYNVWDQRLCAVPSGDFFRSVKSGKVSVVTNTIERFVPEGIKLANGEVLEADIIVTATGLILKPLGGGQVSVDGELVDLATAFAYRGLMIGGVPNASMTVGYINSSWTLRADLVSKFVTNLLKHMRDNDYGIAVPVAPAGMQARPILDLASGYIQRYIQAFPKVGNRAPWVMPQNYVRDMIDFGRAKVTEDMSFFKKSEKLTKLPETAHAPAQSESAFADHPVVRVEAAS